MHIKQEQITKTPLMSQNKTGKTVIIVAIAIFVVCGGLWTINTILEAREKKAYLEHEYFEKQRFERVQAFYAIIDKAENLAKDGFNTENNNYEQKLIEAYIAYEEVEKDTSDVKYLGANIPDVSAKKQKLIDALQTALVVIRKEISNLKANGEPILANEYENKAKRIEQFIQTHK